MFERRLLADFGWLLSRGIYATTFDGLVLIGEKFQPSASTYPCLMEEPTGAMAPNAESLQ